MEPLKGGREGIFRDGSRVCRPAGRWSAQVQRLLRHVRGVGFLRAPEPFGFDDMGREIVGYIEGSVSDFPLSEAATSIEALESAARLLRDYHEATLGLVADLAGLSVSDGAPGLWQLPVRLPVEVICHGDFAPYNVVLAGRRAVGVIDFDAAHPGPRAWDLAYALYRWAPFTSPANPGGFGRVEEQIVRGRAFCDAYGFSREFRSGLAGLMVERLRALLGFMEAQASAGDAAFVANIASGHARLYAADIAYIELNSETIERGLVG